MSKHMIPLQSLCWVLCALLLGGCSGATRVQLESRFPTLLIEPRELRAAIIMSPEFSQYVATPNKNMTLEIGASQRSILEKTFRGLIDEVVFVDAAELIEQPQDIIIRPSVIEVQVAVPSENYLNVYEVWIKYNLAISDGEDNPIENWFMPVYGKTASAFMLQKDAAVGSATTIALRDIGAKLSLDFYRIPALQNYLDERRREAKL